MGISAHSAVSNPAPGRPLQAIGATGAVLALAILAASVLLRLTTVFDAAGQAISTLPAAVESATRLVHRLAASGVGVLALSAAILCWMRRRSAAGALRPTVWIAVATIVLAVIGPLTPGYKFAAVTVANVVGGMVLLMSCWWLRESLAFPVPGRAARDPLLVTAFFVLLLHAGSGAAASAFEMRGIRLAAFVHVGTAMLATMFVGAVLWERRGCEGQARTVGATTLLLTAQLILGLATMWIDPRPVWMGFVHAMLSLLFACGLVSVAVRTPGHWPDRVLRRGAPAARPGPGSAPTCPRP